MGLPHRVSEGFTLVELAITLVVIGLMLAIGLPAYHAFSQDQQLQASAEAIVSEVQLARVRAMSTGATQTVSFDTTVTPPALRSTDAARAFRWPVARGIRFAAGTGAFTLTSDGRASSSQYIVLQNRKGVRDTVSVETSGLVLAR